MAKFVLKIYDLNSVVDVLVMEKFFNGKNLL